MDLTDDLWKAYKAAPDIDFITYNKDKKSQVDDGRASYNAEELMTLAENKYEARLLDEDNAWGSLSDEQEQVLAMTTEIKALKQGKVSNSNKNSNIKCNKKTKDKNNKDAKKKKNTNNK